MNLFAVILFPCLMFSLTEGMNDPEMGTEYAVQNRHLIYENCLQDTCVQAISSYVKRKVTLFYDISFLFTLLHENHFSVCYPIPLGIVYKPLIDESRMRGRTGCKKTIHEKSQIALMKRVWKYVSLLYALKRISKIFYKSVVMYEKELFEEVRVSIATHHISFRDFIFLSLNQRSENFEYKRIYNFLSYVLSKYMTFSDEINFSMKCSVGNVIQYLKVSVPRLDDYKKYCVTNGRSGEEERFVRLDITHTIIIDFLKKILQHMEENKLLHLYCVRPFYNEKNISFSTFYYSDSENNVHDTLYCSVSSAGSLNRLYTLTVQNNIQRQST